MHLGVNQYKGQDIPEAFADHFNDKVRDITTNCSIDPEVYKEKLDQSLIRLL